MVRGVSQISVIVGGLKMRSRLGKLLCTGFRVPTVAFVMKKLRLNATYTKMAYELRCHRFRDVYVAPKFYAK